MNEHLTPNQLQPREQDNGARVVFHVPRAYVKDVKVVLERHGLFDRRHGITPAQDDASSTGQQMRVPTTIPCVELNNSWSTTPEDSKRLSDLQLEEISPDITLSSWTPTVTNKPTTTSHNPLHKALRQALESLPPGTLDSHSLSIDTLTSTFPDSYSIYKPLLLLPSASLSPAWHTLITQHPRTASEIWSSTAPALSCTHIALNSPIPASNPPSSAHASDTSNILRSPVHLTPLHGSFGPSPTPLSLRSPSTTDFSSALWVSTTQNGIHQTWAPLYTMFSRGNVKEKARVLRHTHVVSCAGATAVDMYAGIGYFAFSYRRAGLRVLCWELNPWSVEGMRRGAAANAWTTRVFRPGDVPARDAARGEWEEWRAGLGSEDFWIFNMGNETAGWIVEALGDVVHGVRHVNLGLLPVSRLSWEGAVRVLDARLGGWVHAHENVGVDELDERRGEVEREFQRLAGGARRTGVQVEHVEKVKMYAPGVVHAVFDVHVPGTQEDK